VTGLGRSIHGFFHTAATGDRRYDLPSSHERKKAGQVSLPGFD
jgi:hypothetical protein